MFSYPQTDPIGAARLATGNHLRPSRETYIY